MNRLTAVYRLLLLLCVLLLSGLPALQAQTARRPAPAEQQSLQERPSTYPPAAQPGTADYPDLDSPLWLLFWVVVIPALGYFLIRLLTAALRMREERHKGSIPALSLLLATIRLVVWALVVLVLATVLVPHGAATLVLWAAVSLALLLAAQDLIKNTVGGISLLLAPPFRIGDKIAVGPYYGEVMAMGLRFTRLRCPDDSLLDVPNALFLGSSLSNATGGESSCQVVTELFLPLNIDTARVRQLALEAAQVSRYVYQNKPVSVYFTHELRHTKSWLKLSLTAYVLDIRYELAFRSELTEILMRELSQAGLLEENASQT